ncbi:ABC transporter ATP-binding protein [Enterococcus florum]|uniref:ABC transporter ATP-binding protein n=1 Tax=Enterococcus florum TaxID=2480627 RepID=A0A4P5P8T7_9ENTE|nr:ATP-binding cassette domain-containing protein [Enterococcus florum]GCF94465.1 ABC transporter ATP-binding protein [Enterococcus florum]
MSLLELKQVSYQTILKDVSLQIEKNAFLTISGPSGGGKSTLLRLIASLLTPTQGKILFEEREQSDYPYTTYRQEVSYCFQQPALFGDTVRDNLAFPYLIRDKDINQAEMLEYLNMVDLPKSDLDKSITLLSGGERQRVALIRNVLFLPKVLLLDEVTVGLDERTKAIIHQLILTIHQKGCTILQVTHDEAEIKTADDLLLVQEGRLMK